MFTVGTEYETSHAEDNIGMGKNVLMLPQNHTLVTVCPQIHDLGLVWPFSFLQQG